MGGLLERQQNLGNGDDPFALMKAMTDTMQQPTSGPINFSSYLPGGANFKQPSINSYAALAKQKRNDFDMAAAAGATGNSFSAIGSATTSGFQGLRGKTKDQQQQSFSQN